MQLLGDPKSHVSMFSTSFVGRKMIEVPETIETETNGSVPEGAGKEHMRLVDDALVPGHLDP